MAATESSSEQTVKEVNHADQVNTDYFSSYEDLTIHALMLKDRPRTLAYKRYIEKNAAVFKDKVVIDVGAGTGILSLFAAKAGAKKVYAIEASKLSEGCQRIVDANGYKDVIEVVHGRVEDVQIDVKADVIVSEWMGFYLLHESMLTSVIVARDKWLKDDGLMLPSTADIHICPVSMKAYVKEHFEFWEDVYGFDFSTFLPSVQAKAHSQPVIETLVPDQCLSEPELLSSLDMQFVTAEDVHTLLGSFNFKLTKHGFLHGFACWFDVHFEGDEAVTLHTGPAAEKTHWQQTVMFIPEALMVSKGETISCKVVLSQNDANPRRYDISLEMETDDPSELSDSSEEEETDTSGKRERTEIIGLESDITDKLLEALAKKHRSDPS